MKRVTYGVVEELRGAGKDRRVSYGIAAYADTGEDGTATVLASVSDITPDKQRLGELVLRCNHLGLSLLHLHDVVEDFLIE